MRLRLPGWLAGSNGTAVLGFGLLVAFCVFVSAAAPRESLVLRTRALQQELSRATPLQRYVTGSVSYSGYASAFSTPPGAAQLAASRTQLANALRGRGIPLARAVPGWTELATGLVPVSGLAPRVTKQLRPPQMKLVYRNTLTRFASLTAGRLPAAAPPEPAGTTLLEVAVSSATASRFGLHPGSRIGITQRSGLVVTGIVRPHAAGAPFWLAQPLAAAPILTDNDPNLPSFWTGAAFVPAQELKLLPDVFDVSTLQISWSFPLALGSVNAAQATGLERTLAQAQTNPILADNAGAPDTEVEPISITAGFTGVLGDFVQQDAATRQVLNMLSTSLAVVGTVVVVLGAWLVAERRRRELAALRSRGASVGWVALLALRVAAAVVLPPAVVALALAVVVTPGGSGSLGWLLPALTVAVALVSLPTIAAGQHRRLNPAASAPEGGGRRRAAGPRLIAEVALLAASAGGIAVLASGGASTAARVSLYPSLAPVLVAIPTAIVVMRLYPPALRGVRRLTGARSGTAGFVGFARPATAPAVAGLPVFALVLALSVVAFGATVRSAVAGGEETASWQRTGADAVVDASTSQDPLDAAARRAIANVPGVEQAAAVTQLPGGVAGGALVTVAAVNPARYGALVAATPLPAFPAARLARRAGGGPVPVLASPAAANLMGGHSGLLVYGTGLKVRIVGTASRVPGITAGSLIVLPAWALGPDPPPPTILAVVGPHLDAARLQAVVRREIPGAQVTLRSAVAASLAAAPLTASASVAIALGTAAAAGLCALIILVDLLLSAPAREATLARLRVSGLAPRQAGRLVAAEVLPPVVAGAAGGVACAVAMSPLLGPSLDLSAFTGEVGGSTLPPQPLVLATTAGGLLVLGLVMLGVEIGVRRGAAGPLPEREV